MVMTEDGALPSLGIQGALPRLYRNTQCSGAPEPTEEDFAACILLNSPLDTTSFSSTVCKCGGASSMGKATTCGASITYVCWFEPWMLHFPSTPS